MNDDLIERKYTYDNCLEANDNYTFSFLDSLCDNFNINIELNLYKDENEDDKSNL